MSSLEDKAAEYLRIKGWTVIEPLAEVQGLEVGQVWISDKPRVQPRTITKIATSERFGPKTPCIFYTQPEQDDPSQTLYITRESWRDWVRSAKARIRKPGEPIPHPRKLEVGQVWASGTNRSYPRIIVGIGPSEQWGPDIVCVFYKHPKQKKKDAVYCVRRSRWREWMNMSGAKLQERDA